MGWVAVLLADVFEYLPMDYPGADKVMEALRRMCSGLKACQDPNTGMWCQVVDRAYAGIVKKAVMNADGFINLLDCSSIGIKHSYEEYITQPREISTFAAYGSFIIGTGIVEQLRSENE